MVKNFKISKPFEFKYCSNKWNFKFFNKKHCNFILIIKKIKLCKIEYIKFVVFHKIFTFLKNFFFTFQIFKETQCLVDSKKFEKSNLIADSELK